MIRTIFVTLRAPVQRLLVLALLLAFGASGSGAFAHDCAAAGGGAGHHGESHGPTPDLPKDCECVGAACHAALATLGSPPVLAAMPLLADGPREIRASIVVTPTTAPYILPYAQGPPALPRA